MRPVVDIERVGDALVVAFEGDADLNSIDPLRSALREAVTAHDGGVVVDLRDATFIDSCGISALLNTLRRLTRQGRRMALVADHAAIVRPLELTNLIETLNVRTSLSDALDCV